MSTAWDISTISYDSKIFNVNAQETVLEDVHFKPDGTKMFIIGIANDTVYSYTLSTAWDITTASYDNKSFSVNSQATQPHGLFMKPDGTKMFILDLTTKKIFSYTLSTAWDIATASYDNKQFFIAENSSPRRLFISSDGTRLFTSDFNQKAIHSHTLSTAWDITTAAYDYRIFPTNDQQTQPRSLWLKSDGSKLFVAGSSPSSIHEYNLNTPWKLEVNPKILNEFSAGDGSPKDLFFKPDGSRLFTLGSASGKVLTFDLSTPWDTTTATNANKEFSIGGIDGLSEALQFKSDGTKMYFVGTANSKVYELNLSTPWDVTTAVYLNKSFSIFGQAGNARGLYFRTDGQKMFVLDTASDSVYSYTLSTAWDITTASYDNKSFSLSSEETDPTGVFFKPDGTKMFVVGTSKSIIFVYNLSTPWDITTASFVGKIPIITLTSTQDLFMKDDGTRIYIVRDGNANTVVELEIDSK